MLKAFHKPISPKSQLQQLSTFFAMKNRKVAQVLRVPAYRQQGPDFKERKQNKKKKVFFFFLF
jgi:hypothetical protein